MLPGGRRRSLNGTGPAKVRQPKGKKLAVWWLTGSPEPGGAALVCEGETDGLAGESALRMAPGAAAAVIDGLRVVTIPGTGYGAERLAGDLSKADVREAYLALDADAAGQRYAERAIEELHKVGIRPIPVELPEGKDLAETLAAQEDRGDALANLLANAGDAAEGTAALSIPPDDGATVQPSEEGRDEIDRDAAWEACAELAREPRILSRFTDELPRVGLVGEDKLAQLIYLATTSRLLDKPVSVAVKGPSAGGKSYIVEVVIGFFPEEAVYTLSAMSERALAYSEEPLEHRMLVVYEAAGMESEFASYLLRSLLSEGCVRYETVEKTSKGMRARLVERKGPTGLIVTTTRVRLHPENETRLLSMTVKDTAEQTKAIMQALAEEDAPDVDLGPWHALQRWLAPKPVTVPYGKQLAQLIPPAAVRLRRDFGAVLGLIRAHALLHQVNRHEDEQGRVVATVEDYGAVRELVHDLVASGIGATVSAVTREKVEAVEHLAADDDETGVTQKALAAKLGLDKSAVNRRVRAAIADGYLRNLEERRGHPSRLVTADPLPDDLEILPSPDKIESGCTVARSTGGIESSAPENGE